MDVELTCAISVVAVGDLLDACGLQIHKTCRLHVGNGQYKLSRFDQVN